MSIVSDFLDSCSPALERLSRTNPELAESTFRVLIACTQLESEMKPKQTISAVQKAQLEDTCLLFTGSLVNPQRVSEAEKEVTKEQKVQAEEKAEELKRKLSTIVEDDTQLNAEVLSAPLPFVMDPQDYKAEAEEELPEVEDLDLDSIDIEDIDFDFDDSSEENESSEGDVDLSFLDDIDI